MRDDRFLQERLDAIWQLLFAEVEKSNKVLARFKGRWKNKFGHIKKLNNENSEIAINSYFKNEIVPEYVIDATLAHELVHYMHGFNSPLPRKYKHPHAGGIVNRELKKRGFNHVLALERKWVKKEWNSIARKEFKPRKRTVKMFRWF